MDDMSDLVSREERERVKAESDSFPGASSPYPLTFVRRLLATLDHKDMEIELLESSLDDCKDMCRDLKYDFQ